MAKKKLTNNVIEQIRTASKMSDVVRDNTRVCKVIALVKAKEEHDAAVRKAHDDELAIYQELLKAFMKRCGYLSKLVEQLSKLVTLPEVTIQLADTKWVFSAHQYDDANRKPCFGIGAKLPPATVYASTHYIIVGPNGKWVTHEDNTTHNMYCSHIVDNDNKYDRGHTPNTKDFMTAALEWEKQVIALVDSL